MFYSQALLSRKGPLGNIWIASFCFRKLRREQIVDTDISSSVDKIMPEVDISYRVLAQLLLGIVRIFSKKVDYLYHDCNDALTIIRKSFVPSKWTVRTKAVAGLQPTVIAAKKVTRASKQNITASKEGTPAMQMEAMRAPYHHLTITVPERFELDSFDLEVSDGGGIDRPHQQSIPEDAWTDERDQASFLNECHRRKMFAHTEYNSACLTPVDDVLPSHMMDIYLEISELYNSSSLEVRGQKIREDFHHLEESGNHESLEGRISLSPYLHDEEPECQVNPVKLQEAIPSYHEKKVQIEEPKDQVEPINIHGTKSSPNGKPHVLTEVHRDATTPAKTHDKSNFPCDSGLPSPTFTVTTPAKKEQRRMLRKRKNFDETIVLPNEILRMGIHDASTLVCKRRKAPHTFLDAWKACRITNLQEKFTEPLIPCISFKLEALLQKKSAYHSPLKKSAASLIDSDNVANEIPNKPSYREVSLQEKIPANKSSDLDGSLQEKIPAKAADYSEISTAYKSNESIKESSSIETSVSGFHLMDKELGSDERDSNSQDNGRSVRTRAVARYLCNRFLDLKEQKQKEILRLARVLEGQTRAKCATLFYETLALKDYGCIDVQQDSPYGDIVISATPQLEALFRNRERMNWH